LILEWIGLTAYLLSVRLILVAVRVKLILNHDHQFARQMMIMMSTIHSNVCGVKYDRPEVRCIKLADRYNELFKQTGV